MVADLAVHCATDLASSRDSDHTEFRDDWFARISPRKEYRMPERLVSGEFPEDGVAALFAAIDATSPGKRGASGSLVTDAELADIFAVCERTIQRWRDRLEETGHCATVAVGRLARKCVGVAPDEQFVMVPWGVVRALLTGEIQALDFRLWVLITNTRIKYMGQTGCWRGIGWFAKHLHRNDATIKAAFDRLVAAALLRIDDFGTGRPRRLVPQFAREVTQKLTAAVRHAARTVYRKAGLLKKPQLVTATTPPSGVGSTPPSGVANAARRTRANTQVGPDSHASRAGRYRIVDELNRTGIGQADERVSAEWRSTRNSLGKRA
jgi:hypothetical protein